MEVGLIDCPLCGSVRFKHMAQDGERTIVRCRQCGLELLNPQPDDDFLEATYGCGYFSEDLSGTGYTDYFKISHVLTAIADRNLDLLASSGRERGRVLDVGCATGEFLARATERGWNAYGVELTAEGRTICEGKGLRLLGRTIYDVPVQEKFDVIAYWDVLEHVRDPLAELKAVAARLRPGGWFVTTMPNAGSLRARLERGRWWAFYASREHLFFFDRRRLARLAAQAGLRERFHTSTQMDLRLDPIGLAKDLARGRHFLSHQSRHPSISYLPAANPVARLLENRGLGHVLFWYGERLT